MPAGFGRQLGAMLLPAYTRGRLMKAMGLPLPIRKDRAARRVCGPRPFGC
jgi:hypothetical protein